MKAHYKQRHIAVLQRNMSEIINWIERYPSRALASFLALHFAVWTALPSVLYPNLPLDLIEALTYGREWRLGYDKLPPLPWWLVELAYRLFGVDAGFYALAQGVVIIAFLIVFATARKVVGVTGALVALLILDGLHYVHFTAAKFNHDVIQLPFWAAAGFAFHAGLKHNRLWHWIALGLAIGAAAWAKYFVIMLVIPLGLFLLFDSEARQRLFSPGPWLAAATALVVISPHAFWLIQNDFLPFAYAAARAAPKRAWFDHFLRPGGFALAQAAFVLPALVIAAPLFWPRAKVEPDSEAFDRRIVTLLAFGPFATMITLTAVTGRGTIAMWGYPLWLFLGVWIVMMTRRMLIRERLSRLVSLWAIIFSIFAVAFIASYTALPFFQRNRYIAVFYPGDQMGTQLSERFRQMTGERLAYVIGDMWNAGNVAHYAPERPRVLIDGEFRRAPWITSADLARRGAVVVWTRGDLARVPDELRAVASMAEVQPPLTLPFRHGPLTLNVGWAIVRPL